MKTPLFYSLVYRSIFEKDCNIFYDRDPKHFHRICSYHLFILDLLFPHQCYSNNWLYKIWIIQRKLDKWVSIWVLRRLYFYTTLDFFCSIYIKWGLTVVTYAIFDCCNFKKCDERWEKWKATSYQVSFYRQISLGSICQSVAKVSCKKKFVSVVVLNKPHTLKIFVKNEHMAKSRRRGWWRYIWM